MTEFWDRQMAGDYTVFRSIVVGMLEIVMGEDDGAEPGERYLCAVRNADSTFARYRDVCVSDDYAEILELYGQRVAGEAEKLRTESRDIRAAGIDDRPVTAGAAPLTGEDDLSGRVVVLKPGILKRECRRATHQYQLVTGGFGAKPGRQGSACFCVNLYTGRRERFERYDILGTVRREDLPGWAEDGLRRIEREAEHDGREER